MPITKEVLSKYVNRVFIETGSYEGASIHLALEVGFKKIYSIEILPYRVRKLSECFKDCPVTIMEGDSSIILPDLIKKQTKKVTVWLDAHESVEPITTGNKYPLAQELACLVGTPHTILIDDVRLFYMWGFTTDKITRMFSDKTVTFEKGCQENDIMVLS
jgi:hypothetical protein